MEQQKYESYKVPVVISVPVNLRNAFPSKTLRNFFTVANGGMQVDKTTTLDDIIENITCQLKSETEKHVLQGKIGDNVRLEKKIYSRFVPLFIKKLLISAASNIVAESKKTMTISNMGKIPVPDGFLSKINHIEVILYPTPQTPLNCAACCFDDKLAISFARTIAEADIIRFFFNYLTENIGLDVEIYSNDWGNANE